MRVMQGTSPAQHGVMDAESALDRLMPAGSVYAFLAEHRRELFPDAMFADLFPSALGRPSVPADVVAAVLVLQALEGRSDRDAAEALSFDLRWKAACGWPVRGGRTGSSTPSARSSRRPAPWPARRGGRWIPRCWRTRWPPRTPSCS